MSGEAGSDADLHRELRRLAESAAHAAGAVAHEMFRRPVAVRRKPDGSEVSDADERAQQAAIRAIRLRRPNDLFVAEESQPDAKPRGAGSAAGAALNASATGAVHWIIDPIDGTRNYLRGVPLYACSIAAMVGGMPVAGVVYVPETDTLYSTSTGEPLRVNDTPANAAPPAEAGRKPVVAVPSSADSAARELMLDWLSRTVIRNLGSTALHLALVATGEFDGAMANDCRLWDIAAGWLLIRSAGGAITTPEGRPVFPLDPARYAGEALPCVAGRSAAVLRELTNVAEQ
ncbi:MAG: inositol monophosphatase [Phycisphaerae bacterium]